MADLKPPRLCGNEKETLLSLLEPGDTIAMIASSYRDGWGGYRRHCARR